MKTLYENNKISIIMIVISIISIVLLAIYSKDRNLVKDDNDYKHYEEKDIYSGAVSLDETFNNLDISLSDEEISEFIDSSSCEQCVQPIFFGAMFNENISDEYKLMYTINRATWQAFETDEKIMSENYGFIVSLKKETIKKLAEQIFAEINIPTNNKDKYYYYGINDLVCEEESCYYTYTPFGLTGQVIDGYETKTTIYNNQATTQVFYITYGKSIRENIELETLTTSVTLKDKYNGSTIANYKEYTFKSEDSPYSTNIFDEFVQYFEIVPTYEYHFNNDNVLISVIQK